MAKAKIGILIPTSSGGPLPQPSEYAAFIRRADELGFDSLWVVDRLFHTVNVIQSLAILNWAAGMTTRIRIGVSVLMFNFWNPVLLAKYVASLDYLSGGRFTLGVSIGGRDSEYRAVGMSINERVGRLREGVAILRKLWTEENVAFQGKYYSFERATVLPRPIQQPSIPILVAAGIEPALRRAAEIGDGWLGGGRATVDSFRSAREKFLQFAREFGKDPASLPTGKLIYISIDSDRQKAKEKLVPFIDGYYGTGYDVDRFTAFGPAEECARLLQEYLDAGADPLIIGFPSPDVKQLERLAGEVVPKLK
ncbi:MAG: LLM class flavin-dependent oxidoreductase [Chloroflexi bacterium]|nr:LLM class flavin-dependent oxidoreductase [Chloroflexota bacterium]